MPGAEKGIRCAAACSCSAFSVPLLPLPSSRLSGEGAPHRFGGREQRDRGEPACVPLKSTKPTRCGVGIFKIRGKRQAMTLRIDPSVGRVGPSFHLATGITLRRRRRVRPTLVWHQLIARRCFTILSTWRLFTPRDHSTGNRLLVGRSRKYAPSNGVYHGGLVRRRYHFCGRLPHTVGFSSSQR